MHYRKLNRTDLEVSPICLGTVNYDTALLSKADSKRQLSRFVERGGNFVDTAHVYGMWEPGATSRSEAAIGEWIRETGKRDSLVLATKGAHPEWGRMSVPRVRPRDIEADLEESLRLLGTDHVDLYFLHRDDPAVPVSDIVDCLDRARERGKIRWYGCSNWKLGRIREAAAYAAGKGSPGFVVNQLMLSLADINFHNLPDKTFVLMDRETAEYHAETGLNVMAYMSIAKAYFTRRHQGEKLPESVTSVYGSESNDRIYERARAAVDAGEYTFMDLSLMYLMAETRFPTVPIASFDTPEQLEEGLSCWDKPVPGALLAELGRMKRYVYFG
ncbi:MAG TPA: aldo/keto reductase [Spirochaetia bacterium]|nr:aldo/keto reductase [Spirochaetales bacterium]HRY79127.1 aldo/keto reductase [Spirochaetia bacterium]HRZ88390.1 aldo/keto reductase [Spirochaetia bacterium]